MGHIVSGDGIAVETEKVKAIEAWTKPKNKLEIQAILRLVHYYIIFLGHCSEIAEPLTEVTKNVPFQWNPSSQESFEQLKSSLTSTPVLTIFDQTKEIFVTTDAAQYASSSVFEQKYEQCIKPVAYFPLRFNSTEVNYSMHERKLLSIVETLRAWRAYLHGIPFIAFADNYPLRYLETQEYISPRQVH